MKSEILLKPSYWANDSGGKDSLFMLKYILNHRERYPLNGVVHFELEIDYPFIKNVVDYMESECKNLVFLLCGLHHIHLGKNYMKNMVFQQEECVGVLV